MRALTVRREWAWLIAEGHKRVENRTWPTAFRGQIAIHAGKRADPSARALCERLGIQLPDELAGGAFLATADLVDVVDLRTGNEDLRRDPFAVGPFCFLLANVRKLREPLAYTGRLGLFTIPDELLAGRF